MNKFKIGDKVLARVGLDKGLSDRNKEGPGSGYRMIKDFNNPLIINRISENNTQYKEYKGNVYWFRNINNGIYEFALKPYINNYEIY